MTKHSLLAIPHPYIITNPSHLPIMPLHQHYIKIGIIITPTTPLTSPQPAPGRCSKYLDCLYMEIRLHNQVFSAIGKLELVGRSFLSKSHGWSWILKPLTECEKQMKNLKSLLNQRLFCARKYPGALAKQCAYCRPSTTIE